MPAPGDIADDIIAADNRVHAAVFDGGDGSAVGGVSGMKDLVSQMRSLMSDLVFAIEVGPSSTATLTTVEQGHLGQRNAEERRVAPMKTARTEAKTKKIASPLERTAVSDALESTRST